MKTVGAAYARTHFSRLVREARQGEIIIITRRRKPIARLRGLKPLPPEKPKAKAERGECGMRSRSIVEAQQTLPQVLDAVESGESVTITSHGEPVAAVETLVDDARRRRLEAIEWFLRYREENLGRFRDISIRELIDEGRRH